MHDACIILLDSLDSKSLASGLGPVKHTLLVSLLHTHTQILLDMSLSKVCEGFFIQRL